jgi:hypothetical protein
MKDSAVASSLRFLCGLRGVSLRSPRLKALNRKREGQENRPALPTKERTACPSQRYNYIVDFATSAYGCPKFLILQGSM